MRRVIFKTDRISVEAEFNEGKTASSIIEGLPVTAPVNTWGEEIYFQIPRVEAAGEPETLTVESGDVAFWPEGNCLCVFFGRTPASVNDEPAPASPVILVGKVAAEIGKLRNIMSGENITVAQGQ